MLLLSDDPLNTGCKENDNNRLNPTFSMVIIKLAAGPERYLLVPMGYYEAFAGADVVQSSEEKILSGAGRHIPDDFFVFW